jgi:hypothetical protein
LTKANFHENRLSLNYVKQAESVMRRRSGGTGEKATRSGRLCRGGEHMVLSFISLRAFARRFHTAPSAAKISAAQNVISVTCGERR